MKSLIGSSLVLAVACLSGCAASPATPPPQNPLANVIVERLGDNDAGLCNVKINAYNLSPVAWDAISIFVLARDKDSNVVGQWRQLPWRFTDPGTGIAMTPKAPAEVPCAQISQIVVQYFGVHPTGKGQVRISSSLVESSLK